MASATMSMIDTHDAIRRAGKGVAMVASTGSLEPKSNLSHTDKRIVELEAQVRLQSDMLKALQSLTGSSEVPITPWNPNTKPVPRKIRCSVNELRQSTLMIREEMNTLKKEIAHAFHEIRRSQPTTHRGLVPSPTQKADELKLVSSHMRLVINDIRCAMSLLMPNFSGLMKEATTKVSQLYSKRISDLESQLQSEISLRRKLHNQLIDVGGNVRVFARIRPLLQDEIARGCETCIKQNLDEDPSVLTVFGSTGERKYTFDKVFGEGTTNSEIFSDLSQLLVSSLDGYNVSILAYGATNSGKTYTMNSIYERVGLELIDAQSNRRSWKYSLTVSVCEIYMDTVVDLLNPKNINLDIRTNPQNGHLHVPGLSRVAFSSSSQLKELITNGTKHRAVSATLSNEHSSRSHLITCIYLDITSPNGRQIQSRVHLVDLAGSERLAKCATTGQTAKETLAINKSLSALGDVVYARFNKMNHVPYRNSVLTSVLNESLAGDSKTLLIVQVNPTKVRIYEHKCTKLLGLR